MTIPNTNHYSEKTQKERIKQTLSDIGISNLNANTFFSAFYIAYANLCNEKKNELPKELTPEQHSLIFDLANHLHNTNNMGCTRGDFSYPIRINLTPHKNHINYIFQRNFIAIKEQINTQTIMLQYCKNNLNNLGAGEKSFLNKVIIWQKKIEKEIKDMETNVLSDSLEAYIEANQDLKNLHEHYYDIAVELIAFTSIVLMISAPIFFVATLPLVLSAPLVAAGLDGPVFIATYIIAIVLFSIGASISESDNTANNLYEKGWIDTAINFFSKSKKAALIAERDEAKKEYEKAKKPFDQRCNAIKKKAENPPAKTSSIALLSDIFVQPINARVSAVTQAQVAMNKCNENEANSKFKQPVRGLLDLLGLQ